MAVDGKILNLDPGILKSLENIAQVKDDNGKSHVAFDLPNAIASKDANRIAESVSTAAENPNVPSKELANVLARAGVEESVAKTEIDGLRAAVSANMSAWELGPKAGYDTAELHKETSKLLETEKGIIKSQVLAAIESDKVEKPLATSRGTEGNGAQLHKR